MCAVDGVRAEGRCEVMMLISVLLVVRTIADGESGGKNVEGTERW